MLLTDVYEQTHEHVNSLKDAILLREEQISELMSKVEEVDWRLAESGITSIPISPKLH